MLTGTRKVMYGAGTRAIVAAEVERLPEWPRIDREVQLKLYYSRPCFTMRESQQRQPWTL